MAIDLTAGIVCILKQNGETASASCLVPENGLIATSAHMGEMSGARPGGSLDVIFHTTSSDRVWVVVFSPGGQTMGSDSRDNTVRTCTTLDELVDLV